MILRPALLVFPAVYCLTYVLLYMNAVPVFIYYPKVERFFLQPQSPLSGPGMLYYGWVAAAFVAATIVAAIVAALPRRWTERISPALPWVVSIAALSSVLYRERIWLLP